ncbi:response regulator [Couchioplanes caeruleus]|uniref:DNA-binding response regulator n=2 Tax=Couchioplanes caeruleus TaxID=56438 RepID=A0A1K0GVG2_9ACTN|nr:response regulator transcription factor [Couchioplanes caeruleus]OJF13371.1 DNA-binding response regulator [Couchioplanes caeruleus subsp. caeruleus]ROP33566.1 LuxR family two component transcriptional regulator [Couchioplanes caeruleus]
MARVLVVDDQILVRAGLAALIRAAPGLDVVGEASDGRDAVAQAAANLPEVILMDVRMPGLDGVEATRQILSTACVDPPKVIILTTFDLDEYVYAALRAGASGFLLKDTAPERLLAAIHTVAGGDMLFAPSVTRRLVEAYAHRPRLFTETPPDLRPLTGREREVLELVATGMTNADIARRIMVSEATVKTHLSRTMTKLGLSSRAQAVVVAYETGLATPGNAGSPTDVECR